MLEQIHSEDVLIRDKAFEKAYDTGQLHYESRMLWKDKSVHWIEAKGKVFYDEDNHPSHLIGTIRDITEEKFYPAKIAGTGTKIPFACRLYAAINLDR